VPFLIQQNKKKNAKLKEGHFIPKKDTKNCQLLDYYLFFEELQSMLFNLKQITTKPTAGNLNLGSK